ncbi:prealbumin-like fold domain-containing protein [Arcanobacterium hippocoleae]|uniref:prealbumin-like fold domain-containing protein n=1 Tax=Arcanobacterium hippocoleae TaxID=149017 RepID=UPI00333E9ED5
MKVLHRGCGRSEQVRKAAHRFVILRSLMAATLTFGVLFTSPAERIYAISQPVAAANFQSSSVNTLQTFKSEPAAANQSQPAGQPAAEAAVAEAAAEAPAALPPATESPLATANVLKNIAAETASANTAQPKVRKRRSTALAEIIYFPNPDVLDSLPGYACPPVNPATSTNMSYSNCRCEVPQVHSEREQSGNFAYVLTTQALYKVGLNYNGTVNSKYHLVGYLPYSEYVSPGATGKHDALGINRRTNEVFFAHRSGEGNNIGGANQAVAFYHYNLDELPADKDNLGTYFLQHPQPKFFVENLGVEIDAATVDPSGNYIFGGVNRVADEANARSRGYSAGNEYNTFNFKLFSYNPKTRQVSYLGDIEERAEAVDPNDSYSVRDKHFDLTFDAGGNLYLLSGSSAKKFPGAQLEDQRFMSEYAGGSENTTYDKLYHNTVRMRRVNAADYDTALRNGVSLAQSGYVTNFKNQWTIAAGHARYNENPDIASVFAKPFANLPIDPKTGLIRFDSFQNPGDPKAGKIDRDSHPKWTLRGAAANRKEIDSVYVRGFFMGNINDESKAAGMVLDSSGNLIVSTHDGLGKSVYDGAQENSNSIGVRAFSALTGQRINNGALSFNTSRGPSGVSAGMCDPFNWGGKNAPEPKSNYYRDIFPVLIGDYHQTDMDYGGSLAPVARVKKIIAGERAHTQDQFTVTMKFAGVHNFAQYHMESTHTQGTASESPYSRDLLVTPGNTLIIEEKGTRNGKQFTWANWSQYTSTLKCTHAKGNVKVPALAETVGDKRTWKFQVPENISGIMECQVKNTTEPELQGSITLIKKGENNQPLANAGFTLYRDEDQNGEFSAGDVRISAELLTNGAGIITWNDLQLGAYVAVETKVPAEYRVPTNNNFPVILAKSGTTTHAQIEVQNQRKPPIGNTPGDPAQVCLLPEKLRHTHSPSRIKPRARAACWQTPSFRFSLIKMLTGK